MCERDFLFFSSLSTSPPRITFIRIYPGNIDIIDIIDKARQYNMDMTWQSRIQDNTAGVVNVYMII